MESKFKKMLSISMLSISLSAPAALVPVLANLGEAYPEWRAWLPFLLTLPSLFMMFSSLFTSKLLEFFSFRFLVIGSLFLVLVSGITPYFFNSFPYLLCTRAIMGIGIGLLNTTVASLPAIYFEAESVRHTATGLQAAFISAGGIIFSLLSGILATLDWKLVFWAQLTHILPILVAIFLMPSPPKNPKTENTYIRGSIFIKEALFVVILSFICIAITCTYPLNLSVFITNQGLGNTAFIGMLTSVNSLIGFLIGLIFGQIVKKTKSFILPIGLLLASAGLFTVSFAPSSFILLVGSMLFGVGTSFISPALYARLYKDVPSKHIVSAVALLGIGSNVSQFVSPFIINPVAKLIDGTGKESTRFLLAGTCIVLIAIFLILESMRRKDSPNEKA